MKQTHVILTAAFACFLAVAGLGAQAPDGQQPGSSPATSKTTITGCVERADQVVDRGNLGTTVDSQTFVLIQRHNREGVAGTSGSGAPAAGATDTAAKPSPMYWLQGSQDFNEHVGHQVEVVGTVVNRAPGALGTGGANTEQSSATPSAGAPQPLRVESIKMVSSNCPR